MRPETPEAKDVPLYSNLNFSNGNILNVLSEQLVIPTKKLSSDVYNEIVGDTTVVHTSNFSTAADKKRSEKKSLRKYYHLSKTELKRQGILDVSKDNIAYRDAELLNDLWLQYIRTILSLADSAVEKSKILATGDVHGALIEVVQAKNPSCVKLQGIIIQETEQTFRIVGKDNKHRVLLKKDCIFHLKVDQTTFVIYGPHFCHRTAHRSKQKLKSRITVKLV